MKKISSNVLLALFVCSVSTSVFATGPYTSEIKTIQTTSIGNSYNTVHLNLDVTDSPCSNTNTFNRFTITNNVQHSVVLAALMSGKPITIYGTGTCNGADIETIGDLRISP